VAVEEKQQTTKSKMTYRGVYHCFDCGKAILNDAESFKAWEMFYGKDTACKTGGYHPTELREEMDINLMEIVLQKVIDSFDELEKETILDSMKKVK